MNCATFAEKSLLKICSSPCVRWIRFIYAKTMHGHITRVEEGAIARRWVRGRGVRVDDDAATHLVFSFINIYFWRFAKDAKFAIRRTKEKKHKQAFGTRRLVCWFFFSVNNVRSRLYNSRITVVRLYYFIICARIKTFSFTLHYHWSLSAGEKEKKNINEKLRQTAGPNIL